MHPILRAKYALEESLVRPLGDACFNYLTAWAIAEGNMAFWTRVGHQQTLQAVLEAHYARVLMSMSGRVGANDTLDHAALSMQHAERLRARAHAQAMRILAGMDRDLANLSRMQKALGDEIERKDTWSTQFTGRFKETAKQGWEKLKRRLKSIANVETQGPAEEAQIEWVKQKHADSRIVKVWHNMGDERVRGNPAGLYAKGPFDHWSVEGQEVYIDQPFNVSGEQLRFPGDSGLGASLGNLINCRCSNTYFLVKPDGTRMELPLRMPSIPARRTWREGDRLGVETPIRATELVTLNGRTRARIVLGDGKTFATMRQERPDLITITVAGRSVARAMTSGRNVTSITVAPEFANQGIEELVRRSVAHSFDRLQD